MNRTYLQLTTAVVAVCVISAGLLGASNLLTEQRIEHVRASYEARLRGQALVGNGRGDAVEFTGPHEVGPFEVYEGTLDGKPVGSVFTVTTLQGYSGKIDFVLGVSPDGQTLTGIRIVEHGETPGLGANATEIRYGDSDPWFCAQFGGLAPSEVRLQTEGPLGKVEAITGATITSRAITNRAREAFETYREALAQQAGAT